MNGSFRTQFVAALMLALSLTACQPALNWRELTSEHSTLRVMLPCKPDRAVREVPLGGQNVALDMMGCEADGAMFAVSHARLSDPAQAGMVLDGWRTAVLLSMRATDVRPVPFSVNGAMGLPQSVRVSAVGQKPDGGRVGVQAVWFARVDGAVVDVFHAVVLRDVGRDVQGERAPSVDAANTFFEGLRLP